MIPADVAAALAALHERRADARFDVRWHASLPSTMDAAAALAHDGAAHGVVVAADEQTAGPRPARHDVGLAAGRGTLFLVHRQARRRCSSLSLLTLAAGVAVRDGIVAATGLAADLKWPNDLLVGKRKLAGILAEGLAIGTPRSGGDHRRRRERAAGGLSARRARARDVDRRRVGPGRRSRRCCSPRS